MKVLFTHSYFIEEDDKEQGIMRPYPPLGLLYISAYCEKYNVENEVFDSTFSSFEVQCSFILEHKPKYLAVYINLMTKLNVLKLIDFVKEAAIDSKVILGGPDVKYNAEALLNHGADYLIIGEGEESFYELITCLDSESQPIKEVDGICYLSKGEVIFNKERKKMKTLDQLPMPNRGKIDLQRYLDTWKKYHGQSTVNISTMRGCPYSCKWCSRAVYGMSYRRIAANKVVDEIEFLQKTYQPDSLWFVDDVFTVSHKWLEAFEIELEERGIKMPFECITRADRLNLEVLERLKRVGCFRVWIGAESGSQKVIDLMDRRVKVEQVRAMIRSAREVGMEAGTFIMLGYPGETEDDIEETIQHLKQSNPHHFTITVAYPIRGTELYEEIKDLKVSPPDWAVSTDRDIDFKRTYNRKFYDYAVRRVVNEVNFHQRKDQGLLGAEALKFKVKSSLALLGMKLEKLRS